MVIQHLHRADSRWLEFIPVTNPFQGKTVWDGVVERFQVLNMAKHCYAWSDFNPKQELITAVLELPPVKSANDAVKVHTVQQARNG